MTAGEGTDEGGTSGITAAGLVELLASTPPGTRRLVAVAGPPGSGKSTLAEALVAGLDERHRGMAALLPMDGYHFDDTVLEPRGLLPRKGAPETFDVGGLAAMLARLRANEEEEIAVPRFDRSIEIARAGAALVPRGARVIVVEGNYLLLDRAPWSALHPLFDTSVMIRTPEPVLRERLRRRWVEHGLDEAGIAWKLDGNDLPNGRVVLEESVAPDHVVVEG